MNRREFLGLSRKAALLPAAVVVAAAMPEPAKPRPIVFFDGLGGSRYIGSLIDYRDGRFHSTMRRVEEACRRIDVEMRKIGPLEFRPITDFG